VNIEQLDNLLRDIRSVRVAVAGDFCLDAYWILHPGGSEVSVETGLTAQAVQRHYYNPGGAGNIVANLAALAPGSIHAIGVLGPDIFGAELLRKLAALGVDASALVIQPEGFDTYTFAKRILDGAEQPRIDFGFTNRRTPRTNDEVFDHIRAALLSADILIFNQQIPGSLDDDRFISRLNALFAEHPARKIILDSRHYGDRFTPVIRKCNLREAARLNGVEIPEDHPLPLPAVESYARRLFERSARPVFITLGSRGILVFDGLTCTHVPAVPLTNRQLDPVGAGDTTLSALALALAAGYSPAEAAQLATLAAAVTVQKLFQTGTANPDEILTLARKFPAS
jgi:bifunctional ADP-heptose synthase (sugar kinase/adenylyltransferase)